MTQREGYASAGAVTAARPATGDGVAQRERSVRHSVPPSWESFFHSLPREHQSELLLQAKRQGYLVYSDLPQPADAPSESRVRPIIQQSLHTPIPQLPGFLPTTLDPIDEALDPVQRHAVASALNTPDIFVIEGVTGTGKSRCIIELIRQAVRLRWRVLVVSPSTTALDTLLERFVTQPDIWAQRFLGRDEQAGRLSPIAQDHLEELWPDRMRQKATDDLQRRIAERQKHLALLATTPALLDRIAELIERCHSLDQSQQSSEAGQLSVDNLITDWRQRVTTQADLEDAFLAPFYASRQNLHQQDEETKSAIEEQLRTLEGLRQQYEAAASRAESLQSLAESREQNRWFTRQFWKAVFSGVTTAQQQELVTEISQLETSIQAAEDRIGQLRETQTQRENLVREAEEAGFQAEAIRRRSELEQRLANEQEERSRLDEGFRKRNAMLLAAGGFAVGEFTTAAVEATRQRTLTFRQEQQALLDFDIDWEQYLSVHIDSLISELSRDMPVTFAPVNAPSLQNHLSRRGSPFQLMIVEEAQWLSEAEFLQVGRCASRWVMVGEHTLEVMEPETPDRRPRTGSRVAPQRARRKIPDFFGRLCQRLGSRVWTHEGGRLCVRLMPISAEQRRFIESESVADHDDIELRIYTPEEGEPGLAEVLFPASMALQQAKDYLFRELNEVTLQWFGPGHWQTLPDGTERWGHYPLHGDEPTVALEPGIVEHLYPEEAAFDTLAIDFHSSEGWDRAKAVAWLLRHLVEVPRTPNRVVELSRLHRMCPALGSWLSEVVFNGRHPEPAVGNERDYDEICVDFHPVPGFGEDRRRDPSRPRRDAAPRRIPVSLRSGAGLDTDLSDTKARERIPPDIASRLPGTGFINLNEAQAIVQHLQSTELTRTVGVSALYPAQVELLRILVADAKLDNVRVVAPDDLCACEYEILIISLTRSHGSRAVTFGDDPRETLRLLTRARQRLVMFGDPGTLVRRSQWEGPVDHLDARAADQERGWVCQLVRYLQGVGEQPRVFQLHEGIRL